jgi:PAS domain S-box-containing protein
MSLTLDGYRIDRLLQGSALVRVHLGERLHDRLPIVAKAYAIEGRPDIEARVVHEFALLQALECKGVVRALALERAGDQLVLVLERHGGQNLAEYRGTRMLAVSELLGIGRAVAEILAAVHERGVLHRDIKPSNILIDPATGEVALADFGISVLLERVRARIHDPQIIEGSLPYIAPEQTGRTAREVDVRSDLYSLGATLFELATGRPPFTGNTPTELIHAHLARRPEAPQWLQPELPGAISSVILELLEKAPEHRYQSARGLAEDLAAMADRLAKGESIDEFELRRHDRPTTIRLPQQLFGRERELELLREQFRQAGTGRSSLVVIAGPPGIGKSALLGELLEPVLARRGFLLRGKFDGSPQPFMAIVQALAGLADQLSTSSDVELRRWRQELLGELGGLASAIGELVPRFVAVLGEAARPNPDIALNAFESRNRMMLALQRLLVRVARPEHPVVLAIDDLHWADAASGELLAKLLDESGSALLIVGTTRDRSGEVLAELLEHQREAGRAVQRIELRPLELDALAELLAATLALEPAELRPLAERVARKTGSNPFFVRQFLLQLAERRLLSASPTGWVWDLAAIDAAELPADSLEMMIDKLARLDPELREVIELASVIGSRFEAGLLEQIAGGGRVAQLHRLADEGLVAPSGELWIFGHDRIREAAYRALARPRKQELHLALGRALVERGSTDLGVVVEHLDRGWGLVPLADEDGDADPVSREFDEAERRELVLLNGRAGLQALARGAPHAALRLLELASALQGSTLPAREHPDHARVFALELGRAEALGMVRRHADADVRFRALLEHEAELEPHEYAALVIRRIWLLVLSGERGGALEFGIDALRRLGVSLPKRPGKLAAARSLVRLSLTLRGNRLAELQAAAPAGDPRARAAMDVFRAMAATAYVTHAELFVVLVERHVGLLRRHGRHRTAPLVLMQAGLLLALGLDRRAHAWKLVALAKQMIQRDQLGERSLDYHTIMCEQFMRHWEHSYRDCLPVLRQVTELAFEAGDLESADYSEAMRVELSFHAGIHLRLLEQQVDARIRRRVAWGTAELAGGGPPMLQLCRRLIQGPVPGPGELDPCGAAELADIGLRELNVQAAKLLGAIALILFGRPREALQLLDEVHRPIATAMRGTWMVVALVTFHGLAIAGSLDDAGAGGQRARRVQLRRLAKQLRHWARAGGNCWMQAELLEGELAALDGNAQKALQIWQRAADRAVEQRVPMYEGLACERIAALVDAEGLPTLLRSPLERARAAYRHWGAFAKVAQLEREWPVLAQRIVGASIIEDPALHQLDPPTTTSTSQAVDMVSLLRTSQAIASDIRLEDVVERILTIAIENAGADRGVLLLQRGERGLSVVADYDAQTGAAQPLGLRRTTVLTEPIPLALAGDRVPGSLLRWIERARESVVLPEIASDPRFSGDPYVAASRVRSVLGVPIVKHEQLVGLLYLENKLSPDSFTNDRLEVIGLLIGQAASALENARLYEALRGSELRWRTLVERLPDVVVVVDREGRVDFINHLEEGRAEPGVLGNQVLDLLRATAGQPTNDHLRVAFEGQMSVVEVETAAPGRAPRWWMVRFAPILSGGRIDRVIVVSTDITERREAEQQRAHLEAQLRQQQRLESIGTLASGVAHEINNPIQGIMNYAELIAESPGSTPEIREFADEIEHETKRVAAIVRNLLAFSRQEGDRIMESSTVAGIVEGTISLIHAVLRRDQIHLDIALPADLPPLDCKPQQIQQVIMNLVTNARDALNSQYPGHHPDKRIDIGAGAFVRDGVNWMRISVADRGGGIPVEVVSRIFDPFFTTKGRDQGTGLGLAVSHGIVSEHGGELRLDNRPGVGATFHVELPQKRPAAMGA